MQQIWDEVLALTPTRNSVAGMISRESLRAHAKRFIGLSRRVFGGLKSAVLRLGRLARRNPSSAVSSEQQPSVKPVAVKPQKQTARSARAA